MNGGLERRQIYLIQSAVVDDGVCGVAVQLLVVQRIVLYTGGHAV